MSESKHSPEPWAADDPDYRGGIVDAVGDVVCCGDDYAIDWTHRTDRPGNLRRVLACVNACQGLPTSALESGRLKEALELLELGFVSDDSDCDGAEPTCVECRAVNVLRALGRRP